MTQYISEVCGGVEGGGEHMYVITSAQDVCVCVCVCVCLCVCVCARMHDSVQGYIIHELSKSCEYVPRHTLYNEHICDIYSIH